MTFLDNNSSKDFAQRPAGHLEDQLDSRMSSGDVDYKLQAGRAFDEIRYALSLLTGTLLLDLVKADRTVVDRSLAEKAMEAISDARDAVRSCKPVSETARHHHHHVERALRLVADAAEWASKQRNLVGSDRSDAFDDAIHASWDELKKLDTLINGFQMIDLSQGCCSYHQNMVNSLSRS